MTDLFEGNQDQQDDLDRTKAIYEQLVGEGKKFKDNEALAKAKAESDAYIKTLERQLDLEREDNVKIRESAQAGATLEELLEQFKSMQQVNHRDTTHQATEVTQQPIDPAEMEVRFEKKIREYEATKVEQKNFEEVQEKLQERFGKNTQTVLQQQAKELGLSKEEVNRMARTAPKAFFKLMGLEDQRSEDFQSPPRSNQRTDNFSPRTELRDWAYYEKMRVENPDLYRNPKTHVQMHKDASEIDAKYGSGTFMKANRTLK